MTTQPRRSVRFDLDDFKRVVKLAEDGAEAIHRRDGMVPFADCQHLECAALKRVQADIRKSEE